MGMAVVSKFGYRTLEIENLLVLRAAEMRLGNREQNLAITQQILHLASETGIGAPPEFAGRHDLQVLWKLADQSRTPF